MPVGGHVNIFIHYLILALLNKLRSPVFTTAWRSFGITLQTAEIVDPDHPPNIFSEFRVLLADKMWYKCRLLPLFGAKSVEIICMGHEKLVGLNCDRYFSVSFFINLKNLSESMFDSRLGSSLHYRRGTCQYFYPLFNFGIVKQIALSRAHPTTAWRLRWFIVTSCQLA